MSEELWPENWSKTLFHIYSGLIVVFILGVICFWISGPIEIAQICALGLLWCLFGAILNRAFTKEGE